MSHRTGNRFKGGPRPTEAERIAEVEARQEAAKAYDESPSPDTYRKLKAGVNAIELRSARWTEVFNLKIGAKRLF